MPNSDFVSAVTDRDKPPIADWASDFDHTHLDYAAAAPGEVRGPRTLPLRPLRIAPEGAV